MHDANIARINQTYGALTARVHDASYTLERAFSDLEKLITTDAWKSVGAGYHDINEFMDSIRLDQFRLIADQRQRLVRRIKQLQPKTSNRRIAKLIGASDMTVGRDLTNVAARSEARKEKTTHAATSVALNGRNAAKLVENRDRRRARTAAAAENLRHISGDSKIECRLGDFRGVLADLHDIDAVICDPPYQQDFVPRLRDLAALADRILKPDGVLAVLYGAAFLPEAFAQLAGFRPYRWTACLHTPGASSTFYSANVFRQWKPLLIYGGRQKRFLDVFQSTLADAQAGQQRHRWGQSLEAFKSIIEALTEPGDTIVDPCAGGGTTLLAAKATGRHAIGAEIDASCEVFKLFDHSAKEATDADQR